MKRRIAIAYVFLVGLPILLLIKTLEAGRGVAAPPAIAGDWTITLEAGVPSGGCAAAALNSAALQARIAQSGTSVSIALNRPAGAVITSALISGRLSGTSEPLQTRGCEGTALGIEAEVAGSAGSRTFTGRLLWNGCADCAPVAFHANRRMAAGRQE